MTRIAHIENDMSEKFGIPRQSGLVEDVISTIVFEEEFRNPDAVNDGDKNCGAEIHQAFHRFQIV